MSPPASPLRLAVVLSHPIQYYSPWFAWLQQHTGLQLRVFYLWDFGVTPQRDRQFGTTFRWDVDLLGGYDHEFVPNRAEDPGTHHFRGLDNPDLPRRLARFQPHALLLFGYNWLSPLRALGWARCHGVPVILRGDSHLLGRGRPGLVRRILLGTLFRQFAALACVGQANRAYYLAHGVPPERLHPVPHAVDHRRFDPFDPAAREPAARLRQELGLSGRRVLLFAGKFQERKQPVELLRAFHAAAGPEDALVFVGDGPLQAALADLARARPDRTVRFLPFANQSEMPARYLLADIFALPSRGSFETWGLAVNEAMHMGVPCLVSDLVGCQPDLVRPGETGWVFAAGDFTALVSAVTSALRCPPDELARLRGNLAGRIAAYTYGQATAGLLAILSRPAFAARL